MHEVNMDFNDNNYRHIKLITKLNEVKTNNYINALIESDIKIKQEHEKFEDFKNAFNKHMEKIPKGSFEVIAQESMVRNEVKIKLLRDNYYYLKMMEFLFNTSIIQYINNLVSEDINKLKYK